MGDWFTIFTRIGFAARGLVYLAIGYLVVRTGRAEGASDVIAFIGGGVGKWIVLGMAAGFAAYGLWRISDLFLGIEHSGDDKKAMIKRLGSGASGIIHLFLAWQSIKLALGAAQSSGGGGADSQAATVLQLPGGQILLAAVALGLLAAAIAQLKKALSCDFLQNLDSAVRDSWVKWLGRIGYAARSVVFLVAGYFVGRAALASDSSQAGGAEQVLSWLSSPLDLVLASGLGLFGIYALIESRFRLIHTPDAGRIAQKVA